MDIPELGRYGYFKKMILIFVRRNEPQFARWQLLLELMLLLMKLERFSRHGENLMANKSKLSIITYDSLYMTHQSCFILKQGLNLCSRPHPDVRSTVYQIGVREGDESDWEFVRDKYLTEIVASEKRTLMRAMAATENVKLIDIMLNEMATDDSVILTQGTGFITSGHKQGRSTP